jgi:hypothetical protein
MSAFGGKGDIGLKAEAASSLNFQIARRYVIGGIGADGGNPTLIVSFEGFQENSTDQREF